MAGEWSNSSEGLWPTSVVVYLRSIDNLRFGLMGGDWLQDNIGDVRLPYLRASPNAVHLPRHFSPPLRPLYYWTVEYIHCHISSVGLGRQEKGALFRKFAGQSSVVEYFTFAGTIRYHGREHGAIDIVATLRYIGYHPYVSALKINQKF